MNWLSFSFLNAYVYFLVTKDSKNFWFIKHFTKHRDTGTVLDKGNKEGGSTQIKGIAWCVLKLGTNLKLIW